MTINVTEFFRDKDIFEKFSNTILEQFPKNKNLKIWSCACSTGAEAFSIAMVLLENNYNNFTIIATDIDRDILEQAKKGTFTESSLKNIPTMLRNKYFSQKQNNYIICDEILSKVKFQYCDLLKPLSTTSNDIIVCRNVIIYFNEEAKSTLFTRLQSNLNKDGVLFLGATESFPENLSKHLSKKHHSIYLKDSY